MRGFWVCLLSCVMNIGSCLLSLVFIFWFWWRVWRCFCFIWRWLRKCFWFCFMDEFCVKAIVFLNNWWMCNCWVRVKCSFFFFLDSLFFSNVIFWVVICLFFFWRAFFLIVSFLVLWRLNRNRNLMFRFFSNNL